MDLVSHGKQVKSRRVTHERVCAVVSDFAGLSGACADSAPSVSSRQLLLLLLVRGCACFASQIGREWEKKEDPTQ